MKLGTANEVVFQVTLQQTMHDKDIIKLLYLKRHVSTSKTYLLNAKGNVANYATTKEVNFVYYMSHWQYIEKSYFIVKYHESLKALSRVVMIKLR